LHKCVFNQENKHKKIKIQNNNIKPWTGEGEKVNRTTKQQDLKLLAPSSYSPASYELINDHSPHLFHSN